MEQVATNRSSHDIVTFDIVVGGVQMDAGIQVLSISVVKEVNRIPVARIVIRDGSASEQNFEVSNKDFFIPGKELTIKIGRDSSNSQVFKGMITRHAIRINENGNTELHIECRDKTAKMTIGRHSAYYEKKRKTASCLLN